MGAVIVSASTYLRGAELAVPVAVLGRTPQVVIDVIKLDQTYHVCQLVLAPAGMLHQEVTPVWGIAVGYDQFQPLESGVPFDVPPVPADAGNSLYVFNASPVYSGGGVPLLIESMSWLVPDPKLDAGLTRARTSFIGHQSR